MPTSMRSQNRQRTSVASKQVTGPGAGEGLAGAEGTSRETGGGSHAFVKTHGPVPEMRTFQSHVKQPSM